MTRLVNLKKTFRYFWLTSSLLVCMLLFTGKSAQSAPPLIVANAMPGTLLYDHFGVTLELQASQTTGAGRNGGGGYAFNWNSFVPTKNTTTADWTEADWIGAWNDDFTDSTIQHVPAPGTADQDWAPSAGEPYDTEAYYFDNDENNYYIVVVTSVPHFSTDGSSSDVGVVDPRDITDFGFGAAIRSGDLALNFFEGAARNENGTSWRYNYGVDLTQENRDSYGVFAGFARPNMRSMTIGTGLYSTDYDAGGSRLDGPDAVTTDWYTSAAPPSGGSGVAGTAEGNWEHTNFDPLASAFGGSNLGNATVNYYEYTFPGGLEENDYPTYVYEITIARSLFGPNDKEHGEQIGIMYGPGCRNDGNDVGNGTVQLIATVDDLEVGDLVWSDDNNNGIYESGVGEVGINGVQIEIFKDGTPVFTTTTTTLNGEAGRYLFNNLPSGDYYIHIPAEEFQSGGTLEGKISSTVTETDPDDDENEDGSGMNGTGSSGSGAVSGPGDENGIDDNALATNGISSGIFTIGAGTEPTGEDTANISNAIVPDSNSNLTIDFGFTTLIDWGDLPNSFDTSSASNGASHELDSNLYLGNCVDAELDGAADAEAGTDGSGGDDNSAGTHTNGSCSVANDDEDGVTLTTPLVPGGQACVEVDATNATGATANLYGWVDFDGDGQFDGDANELLATGDFAGGNAAISIGGETDTEYCFTVPTGATFDGGETHMRFRMTSDDLSGSSTPWAGLASDGEVEDYYTQLACIGNYVWLDDGATANQQDNSDSAITGLNVNLVWAGQDGAFNTSDDETYTTTTDGTTGEYHFCGLIEGSNAYQVVVPTAPLGTGGLVTVDQGSDFVDSDAMINNGGVSGSNAAETPVFDISFPLTTGENSTNDGDHPNSFPNNQDNLSFDIGFVPGIAIGNFVWDDSGGQDGIYSSIDDGVNAGISNVVVSLFNAGDDPSTATPVMTTTTDAAGHYEFPNVTPGVGYFVSIDPNQPTLASYNASSPGGGHDPLITDEDYNGDGGVGDDGFVQQFGGNSFVISNVFTPTVAGQTPTMQAQDDDPLGWDDDDAYFAVDFGFIDDDTNPTAVSLMRFDISPNESANWLLPAVAVAFAFATLLIVLGFRRKRNTVDR